MSTPHLLRPDIHDTLAAIGAGKTTVSREMAISLETARSRACEHAFLSLDETAALAPYDARSPLKGLAVSIKDLFDVKGQVTAAGSRVLAGDAPASKDAPQRITNAVAVTDAPQRITNAVAVTDAPAVQALKAAGGVVIGRTNMTEFAFSGMGVNPHYGTPANPADPVTPRIPGGSSSGAVVSVASGAAFIGLGSDTGGSLRIPAALCGVVGFKPTACTVPTSGTVPLSSTLDTVGAITRSVRDAALAHNILSGDHIRFTGKPLKSYRLAVAQSVMLDALDATVARAFERTLTRLSRAGAQIVDVPLPEIADLGTIQARGGFSSAEALAWQIARGTWPERRAQFDPRVAQRIAFGERMSAADYIQLVTARQDWIARTEAALQGKGPRMDAVLSPTVPCVAPPIAQVAPGEDRDAEFFRINALMLRNTSVVNLLDGCAISLPCHAAGELPVGLMVWQSALHDAAILNIAQQIESVLKA